MRIKMLTVECGPNGNFQPGDERDVSDDQGEQLIAGRHAVRLAPKSAESAVIAPDETAVVVAPNTAMLAAPEVAAVSHKRGKRGHAA